ncbi:stage II sporulation protein D [Clostridium cylindrosporum]|uniref:Stage II sporulation protein D n=1 Tax=Clostridium cylindrosporum DSM 605 TaxID=1121307 RepID=A0A0J8DEV6_CLOCY|nr:stage II sporulation protein D [Clostridium cylindrosporum]KMT22774.1 stage II sporulation protein D [Clostridium cylindrosporum DSM 605]
MKKILMFLGLIAFLMIGIPMGVVGFSNLKAAPSINKTKETEVKKKEDTKKAPSKVENKDVKDIKDIAKSKDVMVRVYYVPQKKIISLPIEEYIKGVVSSEMPVSFHEEALKAQAIAARSFVVPRLAVAGGKGYSKVKGADVSSEVDCQAFLPKEERMKKWGAEAEAKWRKVSKAVDDTRGQVLTYDGKIATSIKYFSTSGGRTEDAVEVFGNAQPYLKSVESKGEEEAPSFKSQVTVKREEFVAKIKSKYKDAKIDAKNLDKQIKILERTGGNRVKSISVGGKVLTGVEMRSLFGLKSADFTLGFDRAIVAFYVQGYGHGVGMSQWGANEMGKSGKKYNEILTHYYKGIGIEDYGKYIK